MTTRAPDEGCGGSAVRHGAAATAWDAPAATIARRQGRYRRSPRRRDSLAVPGVRAPVHVRRLAFATNSARGVGHRSPETAPPESDDLAQDADRHLLGGRGSNVEPNRSAHAGDL